MNFWDLLLRYYACSKSKCLQMIYRFLAMLGRLSTLVYIHIYIYIDIGFCLFMDYEKFFTGLSLLPSRATHRRFWALPCCAVQAARRLRFMSFLGQAQGQDSEIHVLPLSFQVSHCLLLVIDATIIYPGHLPLSNFYESLISLIEFFLCSYFKETNI